MRSDILVLVLLLRLLLLLRLMLRLRLFVLRLRLYALRLRLGLGLVLLVKEVAISKLELMIRGRCIRAIILGWLHIVPIHAHWLLLLLLVMVMLAPLEVLLVSKLLNHAVLPAVNLVVILVLVNTSIHDLCLLKPLSRVLLAVTVLILLLGLLE